MSTLDATAIRGRYLFLIGLRWFQSGLLIPILVLLMVSRGLSLVEIGLVGAVQGVIVLVLELPTGGLSDSLGRRPTQVLAYVFAVAGLAMLYVADSVGAFVVATALTAIFRALDSGPLEAWYVDAMHAIDPKARIESGLSAGSSVLSLAIAAGALLSGALVALDPLDAVETLALPVLLALGIAVANLAAAAWLLTETGRASGVRAVASSVRAVPGVVREGVMLLRRSRVLAAVVAVELFWGFAIIAFETLFPIRLGEVLGSTTEAAALMGPASSGAWFAAAAGAAVIALVSRRTGVARAAIALRILQGITIVAMGVLAGPVGLITAYLACYFTHGASNPMHSTLLHREVDASHRTTVLSLNSMVFHPAASIGAIVLTAIAAGTSLSTAFIVAGIACAAAAPLYLLARRAEVERAAGDAALLEPQP
ncbi:MAG TPA: MFS transporter [Candidatus Limnocylindria bacterium]|nr:MFS transporter [Candidatus Limnocylindria bacterium]